MKENNGKRARRKALWQRVLVVSVTVLALIPLLSYHAWRSPDGSLAPGMAKNSYNKSRNRPRNKAWRRKQSRHRHSGGGGDDDDDDASNNHNTDRKEVLQSILKGDLTLVRLDASQLEFDHHGNYANVKGSFCPLAWDAHKDNPSSTPMFRDVLAQSPSCPSVTFDLASLVPKVRQYDQTRTNNAPHTLQLGGVVFHESRCGSTLVANLLQAAQPDQHRVYSESPPPVEALRFGEQFGEVAYPLIRDVFYLMSRSTDADETHVFFKIQSVGSRNLPVFRAVFPETPFLFIFRDPVEVLMSHFANGPRHVKTANCARLYRQPPAIVQARLRQGLPRQSHQEAPSYEDYCAAHFATLTETALVEVEASKGLGRAVEYTQLPTILWDTILPAWGISVTASVQSRLQTTAGQYSKGRGNKAGEFATDSEHKQETAWEAVQAAAHHFLVPSYNKLQALSTTTGRES